MSGNFLSLDGDLRGLALGKKVLNLNELLRAGFRVPSGFILGHEVELEKIPDVELIAGVEKVGGFPVAVRSSASLEDLENASFAGQYQTFLNVGDLSALKESIEKCRASSTSPHADSYLKSKGMGSKKVEMNVLVQKMIPSAVAGVAFSIHPVSGREEEALIECCQGLGEKLVSGLVTPTRYIFNYIKGIAIEKVLGEEKAELGDQMVLELSRRMLEIQAFFGSPQDIEWAVAPDGVLWILQSRPITKINWRTDIEEYTTADFKDGGVSARVCTPLMYSLYRDAFELSMPAYLRKIGLLSENSVEETYIGCFYGRPYWNASAVKRAMTKVPGFDEKSFDADLGILKSYGEKGPLRVPMNLKTILGAIPIIFKMEKEYKYQLVFTHDYGEGFYKKEKSCLELIKSFPSLTDDQFFSELAKMLEFHQQTESEYFTLIYANSNYQSDFQKLLQKISKSIGQSISQVSLMGGLTDVSHLESQKGMVLLYKAASQFGMESAEWRKALSDFLSKNYFHGDSEMDLATPRWGENPKRVEEILQGILTSGSKPRDPDETALSQKAEFEGEVRKITTGIDSKLFSKIMYRKSFQSKLVISRRYLKMRETMREYSTRSYYLIRRFVLEAGRRLVEVGVLENSADILMLHTDEIATFVKSGRKTGLSELKEKVKIRGLIYRGYRDLRPPDELGRGVQLRSSASFVEKLGGRTILRGVGCSPGKIEGIVRVIKTLDEAGNLGRDDILVTRFTDPGWTPVLGMVKGVITEVGGILSHAAVIGREFGIPAILNLSGATELLQSGQKISMDGTEGTIEILNQEH
jgi:phosphohistidine swiveling domain-containing protein